MVGRIVLNLPGMPERKSSKSRCICGGLRTIRPTIMKIVSSRSSMKQRFNSIESVITDLQNGKMVIVVDDADRENEGDLIMAAQYVTPEAVNFMAKHGRGLICAPTTSERLQQLGVERMVRQNREVFKTDFQVS